MEIVTLRRPRVMKGPTWDLISMRGINDAFLMMTSSNGYIFRVTGPLCGEFSGHRRGALMFSLICTWINGWVNNREAGDLRRHRTHYDVIVMLECWLVLTVLIFHRLQSMAEEDVRYVTSSLTVLAESQKENVSWSYNIDSCRHSSWYRN